MVSKSFNFNIYKTEFYGQYWEAKNTKAVIVLVHGMGEYTSRYTSSLIPKLTENNYSVVGFDQFGHGKTSGKRGHNPNYEAVLESIEKSIDKAKELFPNKPVLLYGHSMGGNLVINYVLRKNHNLKGIIATSPFLELAFQPPAWKLFFGKILQKIAPSVTLGNELDVNHISRNKSEVQKYIEDPLIHDKVSPNYSLTFIDTGKWALENANQLKTPLFLLHGTGDKITSHEASQKFAKASKFASIKLYENGYHELHNDTCKEELLIDVIGWIDSLL